MEMLYSVFPKHTQVLAGIELMIRDLDQILSGFAWPTSYKYRCHRTFETHLPGYLQYIEVIYVASINLKSDQIFNKPR